MGDHTFNLVKFTNLNPVDTGTVLVEAKGGGGDHYKTGG